VDHGRSVLHRSWHHLLSFRGKHTTFTARNANRTGWLENSDAGESQPVDLYIGKTIIGP
jgi:hypothetical protein